MSREGEKEERRDVESAKGRMEEKRRINAKKNNLKQSYFVKLREREGERKKP